MFSKRITAAIAVAWLSGCAPQAAWMKPGANQQNFTMDSYACEKDTRQSGYFDAGFMGMAEMNGFFGKCMNAHGWYLQPVAASSRPRQDFLPTIKCKVPDQEALGYFNSADDCTSRGGQVVQQ